MTRFIEFPESKMGAVLVAGTVTQIYLPLFLIVYVGRTAFIAVNV